MPVVQLCPLGPLFIRRTGEGHSEFVCPAFVFLIRLACHPLSPHPIPGSGEETAPESCSSDRSAVARTGTLNVPMLQLGIFVLIHAGRRRSSAAAVRSVEQRQPGQGSVLEGSERMRCSRRALGSGQCVTSWYSPTVGELLGGAGSTAQETG